MAQIPTRYLTKPPQELAPEARLYVMPANLVFGFEAKSKVREGRAKWLRYGSMGYQSCRILARQDDEIVFWELDVNQMDDWRGSIENHHQSRVETFLGKIQNSPSQWAGIDIAPPQLMGIINVTPDSFSDGGKYENTGDAFNAISQLIRQGADIVDIGGESTRPGAQATPEQEEMQRVAPIWSRLGRESSRNAKAAYSADTRRSIVMQTALESGATIINDISGLRDDPAALAVVRENDANIVLMHRQGHPQTMNEEPVYMHAALDIFDFLEERIEYFKSKGFSAERIAVDPGIGFGKRGVHNRQIMRHLPLFHALGCPILLGLSRKSLLTAHEKDTAPQQRLASSIAALILALDSGVQLFRVHDVAQAHQAIDVWKAIRLEQWSE